MVINLDVGYSLRTLADVNQAYDYFSDFGQLLFGLCLFRDKEGDDGKGRRGISGRRTVRERETGGKTLSITGSVGGSEEMRERKGRRPGKRRSRESAAV